jgi:hypothetical protein
MTLQSILRERADAGLSNMLLEVYDAAYCAGAGLPPPIAHDAAMVALLTTLEARYRVEVLEARGWTERPRAADELPGWLLRLSQQADTIEGPAVEGWPV